MRSFVVEMSLRQRRTPCALAVFGDPVAGRALALLLQGVGYEAKFVPATTLNTNNPLESVGLVILTLTPEFSAERRESFLNTLRDASRMNGFSILKLTTGPDVRQEVESTGREYTLPWPCSREELLRNVEAALSRSAGNRVR